MSIIHEALKKTQESLRENPAKPAQQCEASPSKSPQINPEEIASFHQAPEPKANVFSPWIGIGITSLIGLSLVASIGVTSFLHYHPNFKPLAFLAKKPTQGPVLADNKQRPIVTAPTNLVLTGTVVEGAHRLAVINHQTYQVGDKIEDKRITSIGFDHVTLQEGKNIFQLRTSV